VVEVGERVRRLLRRSDCAGAAEEVVVVVGRLLRRRAVVASVGAEVEGRLRLVVAGRDESCLVGEVVGPARGLCRGLVGAVGPDREMVVVAVLSLRVFYSLRMLVVRRICCRSLLVLVIGLAHVVVVVERRLTVLGFWLALVVLWLRAPTCLHLRMEVVL